MSAPDNATPAAPIDATTHEREARDRALLGLDYNALDCDDDEGTIFFRAGWQAARRYVPPTSDADERCGFPMKFRNTQTICGRPHSEHDDLGHPFTPSEAR